MAASKIPGSSFGQFPVSGDDSDYEDIDYGTHTLPKRFWTSGKPGLMKDDSFVKRRGAKKSRYETNRMDRAEKNRGRKR